MVQCSWLDHLLYVCVHLWLLEKLELGLYIKLTYVYTCRSTINCVYYQFLVDLAVKLKIAKISTRTHRECVKSPK